MDGFIWCPHCGQPHLLTARWCSEKGKPLPEQKGVRPSRPTTRPVAPRPQPVPKTQAQPDGDRADRERNRARQTQLIGTVIDERYRLGPIIGRGGYGTVFEAENLRFGGRVALKLLDQCDKGTIKRFNQEARIAGTVLHPNVCQVFDVGWVNDRPYCVMELLTGETLAQRIERKGALSVAAAIDIVIQVLGGLSAAHDAGVVHRDVKPQNVFMVRRQGCSPAVKLLDFGLAKALDTHPRQRPGTSAATMPGRVVGTVAYMSPEQLVGEAIDGRSDLFSCGVVLFEAITSVLPWRGRSRADVGTAILRDAPRNLTTFRPRAPEALEAIVQRALTKDRSKRYQTAYEFLRALGSVQRMRRSNIVAPTYDVDDHDDEVSTSLVMRPGTALAMRPGPRVKEAHDDSETTTKMSLPPGASVDLPSSALPRIYSAPPSSRRPGSGSG